MTTTKQARLKLESLDDRTVPAVLDLTGAGSFGSVNGAIVHHMDATWAANNGDQSHGTGPLQAVLGVNHTGTETGYNTTATTLQTGMDTTLSQVLTLGQVPVVTVNGNQYYEFVMNVNEPTGAKARKLTVDELQFFASNVSNLTNYNANMDTLGSGANKVSALYNLTAGDPTNSLLLRAKTNTGAVGEIAFLVPVGNFASASPSSFVYIYTKITGAAGGDEQWGVRSAPVTGGNSPATLSGSVFLDVNGVGVDTNGDGVPDTNFNLQRDPGEVGVMGSLIQLDGTDYLGNSVSLQTTTDADGNFTFNDPSLLPGTYTLSEIQPVNAFEFGQAPIGGGDVSGTQVLNITLTSGQNASGYLFGEIPTE